MRGRGGGRGGVVMGSWRELMGGCLRREGREAVLFVRSTGAGASYMCGEGLEGHVMKRRADAWRQSGVAGKQLQLGDSQCTYVRPSNCTWISTHFPHAPPTYSPGQASLVETILIPDIFLVFNCSFGALKTGVLGREARRRGRSALRSMYVYKRGSSGRGQFISER